MCITDGTRQPQNCPVSSANPMYSSVFLLYPQNQNTRPSPRHVGNSCPSPQSFLYLTILADSDSILWWDDNHPHGCSHSVQHNPDHMCHPVATKETKQPRDDDNWKLEENKFWSVRPRKATTDHSCIHNLLC